MKLSGFGLLPSTCSMFISDIFYIGDLRSGELYDLPFISQWGKKLKCLKHLVLVGLRIEIETWGRFYNVPLV